MSNFNAEDLKNIYSKYLSVFTEIANESIKHGVWLQVTTRESGEIEFKSMDYQEINSKTTGCKAYTISQSKDHVSESYDEYKWND